MTTIGKPKRVIEVTPEQVPVPERIDVPDYPPADVPQPERVPA